jgi:hypothetical protein
MNTKNILNANQIVTLVALAEGIKQVRPTSGPADLNDLARRLNEMAKACDDNCKVSVAASVNGMWFTYPNANALVTKAGLRAEAEANRLVSSTMHLVEDLFAGHAIGQVVIGGFPDTNDTDGDTNEGGDTEVFDRLGHKDVRPLVNKKYVRSTESVRWPMPSGITDGTMLVNADLAKKLV